MFQNKKVVAIIAEYNPFHNGHQYHIEKTRELSGADFILILMSTNFVQRGEPAILDRFQRAEAAISCGADAVFELPLTVSTGSADIFSLGSVSLAHKLGIVDYLSFGAECDSIEELQSCTSLLFQNTDFENSIKRYLAEGLTFPEAREEFLKESGYHKEAKILSSPNNILAVSYLSSLAFLQSEIKPLPIKRKDANHHDSELEKEGNISSAKSIRESLRKMALTHTADYLPFVSYESFSKRESHIAHEDFSDLLFYRLNSIFYNGNKEEAIKTLSSYQDITSDLAGRMFRNFKIPFSFEEFAGSLWGKNYTYTRICRSLYHIILGITKEIIEENRKVNFSPYIRPLAIKKDALGILHEIKNNNQNNTPLLTRIGDIKKFDSEIAKKTFLLNQGGNEIYKQLSFQRHRISVYNDRKDSFMKIL